MKRLAAVFLCLITAVFLLGGCHSNAKTTVSCKELTLTLPGDFIDLSQEEYAQDADFLYGKDTLIVMGIAEEKALLDIQTLQAYTDLVISSNQLSCTAEASSGAYRFTYEATAGGVTYTYVAAICESSDRYWIVQCYCPSAVLPEHQANIDRILDAISLDSLGGN